MSENTHLISMAQQFSGLPMDTLIGGPMISVAQANIKMGAAQCHFILDTCFTKGDKGDADKEGPYEPIMIEMNLIRNVIDESAGSISEKGSTPMVTTIKTTIQVPLLAILPINSLGIDSAEVDFVMTVKSSYAASDSSKLESTATAKLEGGARYGFFRVNLSGGYTRTSSSSSSTVSTRSNESTYSVKVHASQLPMPVGLTTIINAYSQNISPIMLSPSKS